MRTTFILMLVAYGLLCAYVGWRSGAAMPRVGHARLIWTVGIAFLSVAFIAGVMLRDVVVGGVPVGFWLRTVGVTWILMMPYFVVAVALFDGVRVANRRWDFLPSWVGENYGAVKLWVVCGVIVAVVGIFMIGYQRFANPVTTVVNVKINKQAGGGRQSLRAVVASDWHLGDLIGRERVSDYVRRVNAIGADIILIPGDMIDRSVVPLEAQGMGAELEKLRAPLGVYAVLGNHEGYGGADACAAFLTKHGIHVLRDEYVDVAGAFYLAGRNDMRPRKALVDLLAGVNRARPVILIDHQPRQLEEPVAAGVDLQLSGHTHAGQVWPGSWVVPFLYEVSYGYARKGDFQLYVSSGLGLWGFPARIGTVSELVDLQVEFSN